MSVLAASIIVGGFILVFITVRQGRVQTFAAPLIFRCSVGDEEIMLG